MCIYIYIYIYIYISLYIKNPDVLSTGDRLLIMDSGFVCVLSGSEPPSSPQVVEDGGEEDEEELSGGEEADFRSSSGRGSLLTRRGITLRVLLKDGLVEPGNGVLTIHYLVTHLVFIAACCCHGAFSSSSDLV